MLHKDEFIEVSYRALVPKKIDSDPEAEKWVTRRIPFKEYLELEDKRLIIRHEPDTNMISATISGVWGGEQQSLVIEKGVDDFTTACCDLYCDVFREENLSGEVTIEYEFLGPEIIDLVTKVSTREVLQKRTHRTVPKSAFEDECFAIEDEFSPYADTLLVKMTAFFDGAETTISAEGRMDEVEEICQQSIIDKICHFRMTDTVSPPAMDQLIETDNDISKMELDRVLEVVKEQGVLIAEQQRTIDELKVKVNEIARMHEKQATKSVFSTSADPRTFARNKSSGSDSESSEDGFFRFPLPRK